MAGKVQLDERDELNMIVARWRVSFDAAGFYVSEVMYGHDDVVVYGPMLEAAVKPFIAERKDLLSSVFNKASNPL